MRKTFANRVLRGRLRAVVLWAMVPLAVVNSRPVVGCICADGHYEAACPNVHKALKQATDGSCRCLACCRAGAASETAGDCCAAQASSCPSPQGASGGPFVESKPCCRAVVHAPVLPPLVDSVTLDDVYRSPALDVAAPSSQRVFDAPSIGCRVDNDTGQPPLDLVITLGRLII